eukprot:scaffold165563_cov17-Tisochrysis_lutea.AAC.1
MDNKRPGPHGCSPPHPFHNLHLSINIYADVSTTAHLYHLHPAEAQRWSMAGPAGPPGYDPHAPPPPLINLGVPLLPLLALAAEDTRCVGCRKLVNKLSHIMIYAKMIDMLLALAAEDALGCQKLVQGLTRTYLNLVDL